MGNRAVIIEFGKQEGIYLHWNGGRDSVDPMLYYAKHFLNMKLSILTSNIKKVEFVATCLGVSPEYSSDYTKLDCDNWDNGVYVIDADFKIIERMFFKGEEQEEYNFINFLLEIDENMPKRFQKGREFILKYLACEEVEKDLIYTKDDKAEEYINYDRVNDLLQVGDTIYYHGEFKKIIGKNNEDHELIVNGSDISKSVFYNYTEHYEDGSQFKLDPVKDIERLKNNPNSYLNYGYIYGGKEKIKVLDDNNFKILNKEKLDNIYNGAIIK